MVKDELKAQIKIEIENYKFKLKLEEINTEQLSTNLLDFSKVKEQPLSQVGYETGLLYLINEAMIEGEIQ